MKVYLIKYPNGVVMPVVFGTMKLAYETGELIEECTGIEVQYIETEVK